MAHWVGIIKRGDESVATGSSKEQVIENLAYLLFNRHDFGATKVHEIVRQLKSDRDKVAVAYGENPDDVVAKVFSCNCGSVIRHTRKTEE